MKKLGNSYRMWIGMHNSYEIMLSHGFNFLKNILKAVIVKKD